MKDETQSHMLLWPSPERIMARFLNKSHVQDFGGSQIILQKLYYNFPPLKFSFLFFFFLLNGIFW